MKPAAELMCVPPEMAAETITRITASGQGGSSSANKAAMPTTRPPTKTPTKTTASSKKTKTWNSRKKTWKKSTSKKKI
mgnify:CR=1 FL=1